MAAAADQRKPSLDTLENLKLWQREFSVADSMPPLGIVTHILEPLFSYIQAKDKVDRESTMEVVEAEMESKVEVVEAQEDESFKQARDTANKFEKQVTALADAFADLVPNNMDIADIRKCYELEEDDEGDGSEGGSETEEDEHAQDLADRGHIQGGDADDMHLDHVPNSQSMDIDQPVSPNVKIFQLLLNELEELFNENTVVTKTYEDMMLKLNMTYDEVFNIDEWHSMLDYLMDLKVVHPRYSRYSRKRKADYTIEKGKLDIKEYEEEGEEKKFKFGLEWREAEDDFTKVDDLYIALLDYTFNKQLIDCLKGPMSASMDIIDDTTKLGKFKNIVSKFLPNEIYRSSAIPNRNRIMNVIDEEDLMIRQRAIAKDRGDEATRQWKEKWNNTYTMNKKRHRAALRQWPQRKRYGAVSGKVALSFDFAIKKEWQAAIEAIAMYNV